MTVEMQPISSGQPISVEEFDALPEDNSLIYEIENGFLLVNARPAGPHIRAVKRLCVQLESQLPDEFEVLPDFETELPQGRSPRRVPDLVLVPWEVGDQTRVRGDQILLAIEVASSADSAVRDYAIKPDEYAANGIAHYWVVDVLENEQVGLTAYSLGDDGRYNRAPRVTGTVHFDQPFELTVDLDALAGRGNRS
ncbi:Uma2 family endonuclease [Nocardia sp. 2]|uniref:Uma2 family endonuclease n=1 Tax=Nocardia acididurans TaxID=2802282 RepID=A0ABS1M543_9NOCA|nr:Uma2 family endonuclease [Nocardia acididurans]MBL1075441.1 Uma2 family endonuclease [Nocardia acididurans]